MAAMNAWVFLHWSIISLYFSGYFLYVDHLALCLVLWFMLGCYLLHFSLGRFENNITLFKFHYASCGSLVIFHFNSMGCLFDLTHPHLNPLIQTCNMACMGSFYPFPLCYVCCFPMFSMPCHGEYHSSPFCRRFYTEEHPQSRPQVQPVLALAQALAGVSWCWQALASAGWCWLVLAGVGWCWQALAGAGWCWLVLVRAQVQAGWHWRERRRWRDIQ